MPVASEFGYFSHARMFRLGLFDLSLTTANFAISDSDGSIFLFVVFGIKIGFILHPGTWFHNRSRYVTKDWPASMNALVSATAYKVTHVRVL